jgi:hypothetical protein
MTDDPKPNEDAIAATAAGVQIGNFQDHLNALRNVNAGAAITVWKDGTWKAWQTLDAKYAEKDPNWLSTIPCSDAISDAFDIIREMIAASVAGAQDGLTDCFHAECPNCGAKVDIFPERAKPAASDHALACRVYDVHFHHWLKGLTNEEAAALQAIIDALAEARREGEIAMRERAAQTVEAARKEATTEWSGGEASDEERTCWLWFEGSLKRQVAAIRALPIGDPK